MDRWQSAIVLAKELIILHRANNREDKTIPIKSLETEGIDPLYDPIDLKKLGYLELIGKEDYPYKCSYKITEKGIQYLKDSENFLNNYSP